MEDFSSYRLDILCVQETKIQHGGDWSYSGHRLILFESDCRHYGNGFLINKDLVPSVTKTWKVSDRICVLQISSDICDSPKEGKVKSITIINSYAPTSAISKTKPEQLDIYYKDLQTVFDTLTNSTLVILAGDFNAKVGKRKEGENSIGSFPKGYRNENGERLVEFCE